jgi:hypothetical protein
VTVALQSGLGPIVLAVLAYALSKDRTAVPFRDHLKAAAARSSGWASNRWSPGPSPPA